MSCHSTVFLELLSLETEENSIVCSWHTTFTKAGDAGTIGAMVFIFLLIFLSLWSAGQIWLVIFDQAPKIESACHLLTVLGSTVIIIGAVGQEGWGHT